MEATSWNGESGAQLKVARSHSRLRLVRRVALLQIKLLADGVRDVVMMPLSLAAAALGLISGRRDPELYLDRLMHFGRESDHWINLFDHHDADDPRRRAPLDRIAEEIEATILRDYENGGLSAKGAAQLRQLAQKLRGGRR